MANKGSPTQNSSPPYKYRRNWFPFPLFFKLALAFGLLWGLYRLELLQLRPLLALVEAPWLLGVLLFLCWLTFPLCSLRWWWLLQIQGVKSHFFDIFRVVYSAAFFGLYLPGVVGGDVVRVALGYNLSHHQLSVISLSVVVDRLLGMLGLFTLGLLSSLVYLEWFLGHPDLRNLFLVLVATFLAGLLAAVGAGVFGKRLWAECRKNKWFEKGFVHRLAAKITESATLYSKRPGQLVLGWGLSILVHGKNLVILAVLAKAMGIGDLEPWEIAVVGTVTFLINFLPLTPGGIGVGEAAFCQLALWLEPSPDPPAWASVLLVYRAVTAVSVVPATILLPGRFRH